MAAIIPAFVEAPTGLSDDDKTALAKFTVGLAALFVGLTLATESRTTAPLAAAFAASIAVGATVLYFARGVENLGLGGKPNTPQAVPSSGVGGGGGPPVVASVPRGGVA